MLHKGQKIGSLRLVGTCIGKIENQGLREVYVFTNLEDELIFIGTYQKGRKISEEELIKIVNENYPVQ